MADTNPYATKSDYAYLTLREMILGGQVEPGAVLNQATLARTIGISTTPLREALRRLSTEGLVELGAHRDARVTGLSAEEARDLLEMRRSLDPLAVGLAAERRTRDDIRRIREAAVAVSPLPERPAAHDLDAHRRFHAALYGASHNELLIHTLDGLWDKADRYRRAALPDRTRDERDEKAHEHVALVDAVVAGDSEGASTLMLRHIDTSLGAKAAARLAARAHPSASA
ncbi:MULTISPECIES: GntR family transcriptional regulator [unclassified Pseudonocardia]|uniref:GntR family transcriptional regulator n=1 Tax=unclassified Pseudonocardia TaxID=2619320 RepID=UPI0001FFDC93|nr:GntR family transcriptional regulator [Pseudonocardia sp. Ae707_Ps1]OLM19965.1 transcriptional regulator of GntR family [Pseudonocardia sp. Ae707_Ps1]